MRVSGLIISYKNGMNVLTGTSVTEYPVGDLLCRVFQGETLDNITRILRNCINACPMRDNFLTQDEIEDRSVRQRVIFLPEGEDGISIGIEFPQPFDQTGQKVAVGDDVFHPGTRCFLLIQNGDAAVALRCIERKQIPSAAVFTVLAQHIA